MVTQLHYVCCLCPLHCFVSPPLSSPSLVCQLVKSFALFMSVQSFICQSTCQVLCFVCSPLPSPSFVCPLVKSFAFSHLSCPSLVCPLVKSFTLFTSVQSFTCLSTCQVLCFVHVCPVFHLSVHLSSPLLCSRLSSLSLVCLLVKSFALFMSVQSFTCLSTCQFLCFVHVCPVFHLSSPPALCFVCLVLHVCPFLHLYVHLPSPSHCSCLLLSPCFRKKSKTQPKSSSSSSLEARLLQCCIFLHILIQTGCLTPVTACLPVLPPLGWGHDLSMQHKH